MAEETFTSAEIVRAIYRALLKREPDPAGLETHVKGLPRTGVQSALEAFLVSPEYREKLTPPTPDLTRGEPLDIELRLSEDERAALWAHVSAVWTGFGDDDPYWSVLTNPQYKSAKASDREVIEDFYATGSYDLRYLDGFLRRNVIRMPEQAMVVEFGCGVGRVTRWLARKYSKVLAFDVSAPHLRAAEARMKAEGLTNVEFVHITRPEDLSRLRDFDLFFSIIVLQHNPPPIMADILDHACRGLNPGGLALFQAPTYAHDYSFDIRAYVDGQYKKSEMEMHFIPQHEIFRILRANRMDLIEVRQDHSIGNFDRWISNTFFAKKTAMVAP